MKTVTFLVAAATFLSSATTSVDTLLKLNDRYCWEPRFYSSETKCAGAQKSDVENSNKARENSSVINAPVPEPAKPVDGSEVTPIQHSPIESRPEQKTPTSK